MNKLTVLAVLFCILFTTSAIAQVSTDQARMYQLNSTHTGASTTPGLTPPLKRRWTINFGQPISYPLIADGKVFVTVRLRYRVALPTHSVVSIRRLFLTA